MPSDEEDGTMEWETAQRIFKVGMILSFLVAALGILGEVLGWWNDTGEVLATVGSLSGIVLGTISIFANASQEQVAGLEKGVDGVAEGVDGVADGVDGVADGVEQANETLETIDEDLDKLDKLDDIDAGLDRQTDLLAQIRDRL